MRPDTWYDAGNWRSAAQDAVTDALETQAKRRFPDPPPVPPIHVRALTSNWLMAGKPVDIGTVYSVSGNEAHRLVFQGKAEFA